MKRLASGFRREDHEEATLAPTQAAKPREPQFREDATKQQRPLISQPRMPAEAPTRAQGQLDAQGRQPQRLRLRLRHRATVTRTSSKFRHSCVARRTEKQALKA